MIENSFKMKRAVQKYILKTKIAENNIILAKKINIVHFTT